jgi:hypothetical protein
MRHVRLLLFCLFISGCGLAQDSVADLFVGYSYLNIDTNGLSSRQSANGAEVAISGNFNKWLAAEASVSGYYKRFTVPGGDVIVRDYSYVAGPRFNFKPLFLHALIGGDHLVGSVSGVSASQDGLAGAFGGGLQWKFSRHLSFRGSADYVFSRHNILGGPSATQNNVRASVGIVFSFGEKHASEPQMSSATPAPRQPAPAPSPAPPTSPPPATRGAGTNIVELGVFVKLGRNAGAEIAGTEPGGVAALAGLNVGDVINAVDGKPVGTPMELVAELANHAAGDKVRLGYLLRGMWQAETVIVWAH